MHCYPQRLDSVIVKNGNRRTDLTYCKGQNLESNHCGRKYDNPREKKLTLSITPTLIFSPVHFCISSYSSIPHFFRRYLVLTSLLPFFSPSNFLSASFCCITIHQLFNQPSNLRCNITASLQDFFVSDPFIEFAL